jgi:hypothetical protein
MHSNVGDPARPHRELAADDLAAVVGCETTQTKTPPVKATFIELVVSKVVDESST